MSLTPRKLIAIAIATLTLLLAATLVGYRMGQRMLFDRYAGQPQVTSLPENYDPRARTRAYRGIHPSKKSRSPDPYPYPIPVGESGPTLPTYTASLEYPYACRTETSGLGQPLVDNDAGVGTPVFALDSGGRKTARSIGHSKDCSLKTRVLYYYRSRRSGDFLALADDAQDIDEITMGTRKVPFIVRLEMGTINRHIYVIAVLKGPHDSPEKPDLAYWNRKLVYQFRGGVGIGRRQGRIEPYYIPDRRSKELMRGYAVAYSTANQTSNHYDIELAEDTVARIKRQFSARYGEPRYTIGVGGSGGAIQQYLIGQNRPGLLDGGIALYSFPDMVTQTTRVMDCELLEYYFDIVDADNAKWQRRTQRAWIEGFNARDDLSNGFELLRALQALGNGRWPGWSRGHTECTQSWRNLTPQIANPRYTYFASLFSEEIVQRVPWTYWDNLKRVYGTDDTGFAKRTYDNVGVQYGLEALTSKKITIEEFLKLNRAIGGWKPAAAMAPERYWLFRAGRSSLRDLSIWSHHNMHAADGVNDTAPRSVGDLDAMAAAYRSGQVFLGQLSMPIIDFRHYMEPELDMHHSLQSFSARLRLLRGQGHAVNQLIWSARKPSSPLDDAFRVLESWLDARFENPKLSVRDARPTAATDRCYSDTGQIIASGEDVWNGVWNGKQVGACMKAYPVFRNPRIVAGDDYAGDIFKCHLQSVDAAIASGMYEPVDIHPHREALRQTFPDGVCDYVRGDAGRPRNLLGDHSR